VALQVTKTLTMLNPHFNEHSTVASG
jgi:hypothetical protein